MNTIHDLYNALLTIKEYCASNKTCNECPLVDNEDCCIFIKDIPPSNWKLIESTRRLYE